MRALATARTVGITIHADREVQSYRINAFRNRKKTKETEGGRKLEQMPLWRLGRTAIQRNFREVAEYDN